MVKTLPLLGFKMSTEALVAAVLLIVRPRRKSRAPAATQENPGGFALQAT